MKLIALLLSLAGAPCPAGTPALPAPAGAAEKFTLVKTQGAVSLYERWLEIEPGRQGREVKAEFTVSQPPAAVVALLRDEAKAKDWMRRVSECRIVPDPHSGSWLAYVHYNIPWPISNQDCLLRYEQRREGEQLRIAFRTAAHSDFSPKARVKRMAGVAGAWLLTPQADGRTKVTYTVMTTETPALPRWVTDPLVQSNLLDTMNAFCALLGK
jgi:uncharacterized protein YndB with AHSA1/START domain